MEKLIKLEEASQLIASIIFLVFVEADWWWYLILFIGPDISMFGYAINPKFGAIVYNILHHKALAIIFFMAGIYTKNDPLLLLGAVLFGHTTIDRIFGFGLKYTDDFKHTHLGRIGGGFSEE